jgi:hypothetical protein
MPFIRVGFALVMFGALAGTAAPAGAAATPCSDCDLVLAERDLPDGYAYDDGSPERDVKGDARSIQLDDCVLATDLRRERAGVERQSAVFVAGDDPFGADEHVIRFSSAKRARTYAAAFDGYLHDGPECEVIKAPNGEGEIVDFSRLEPLSVGTVGDQRAAIVSDNSLHGLPDRFVALVRTGRTVVLVEAFASEQIDQARFRRLVDDAVAAARD